MRIDDILNQEIEIIGCRITKSKYSKNQTGLYLTLQFINPGCCDRRVVFTGSDVLISQVQKYQNQIPFITTIKKVNRYYVLT